MVLKLVQMAYGAATHVPGVLWLRNRFYQLTDPGTVSARYCYSVWLRHLVMADKAGLNTDPKRVVELGPGNSVGIGLAALISGAEQYRALDMVKYAQSSRNLRVFDEIVELFQKREDIPGEAEFPTVKPYLSSYRFPNHVLTEKRLEAALQPRRIEELRGELASVDSGASSRLVYLVPWPESDLLQKETGLADMVYSQAALEHVMDLGNTYRLLAQLIRPGGFMSSQIDYKNHGTALSWNGHWAYSDLEWRLVLGRRSYLINRASHSTHLRLMRKAGLATVLECPIDRNDGIGREKLAPRFREMLETDLRCSGAYILAVKSEGAVAHST
jgi:hypothetical protein